MYICTRTCMYVHIYYVYSTYSEMLILAASRRASPTEGGPATLKVVSIIIK